MNHAEYIKRRDEIYAGAVNFGKYISSNYDGAYDDPDVTAQAIDQLFEDIINFRQPNVWRQQMGHDAINDHAEAQRQIVKGDS